MNDTAGCPGQRHRMLETMPMTVTAKDGEPYLLRAIQPSDAASLIRGYEAMSDQSKWFRMLNTVPHLSEELALHFCSPDPAREVCIVIIGHGVLAGEILGGARIAGEPDGQRAEFSVSLRPEAQGLGLGYLALSSGLQVAREMNYERGWGISALHNTAMWGLARRLQFKLSPEADDASLVHAEIDLTAIEWKTVAVRAEGA